MAVLLFSALYSLGYRCFHTEATIVSSNAGIDATSMAFIRHAVAMSPVKSACNARCEPHPGHCTPASTSTGHRGNGCSAGSKYEYIAIAAAIAAAIAIVFGTLMRCFFITALPKAW